MNARRLVLRGLLHFRGTHLGALATAALTAAVIVAALSVGDSVETSLARVADARIGRVGLAAHGRDRLWRERLAADLAGALDTRVSGSLQLNATLARPDGTARVAQARVLGVDDAFWRLSPGGRAPLASWPPDGVAVSKAVASRLGLGLGDTLIVRVERPSAIPREAPLRSDSDATAVLSGRVAAVLDSNSFGRFALGIGPLPPANVFLPLARLQHAVDAKGRIDTLLVESPDPRSIGIAVRQAWRLEDAGLTLRRLDEHRGWQLDSSRIFLEPAVVRTALEITGARPVLTWLVNDLAVRDRHVPYSTVAALPSGGEFLPNGLAADQIVVNSWLAEDLAAVEGDTLTLRYFVPVEGHRLEEKSATLRIRAIVPLDAGDPDLMPAFPGLADSEDCRDWDPGFALDLDRIRDGDEAYWDEHRGTPKAFVSWDTGERLWSNPYGPATALRFPPATTRKAIEETLRARLDPAEFGLRFTDLRVSAAAAREQGMDFGVLFLAFSGLLVLAALLLLGLVVALNVAMRRGEIATLRALGFTPGRIRRLFAAESALVALAGGAVGAAAGPLLAAATLGALETVWRDVAGSVTMTLTVRPGTLVIGALAGAVAALGAALLVLHVSIRGTVRSTRGERVAASIAGHRSRRCFGHWIALSFLAGAMVVALGAGTGRDPATAGAFFSSGLMLLAAALSFVWYALAHVGVSSGRLTTRGLAWRNLGRRRGRSLAVIGVLAFGVFMFCGVTVFKRDRLTSPGERTGGTGGFALVGESATAVVHDLGTPEGRTFYALDDATLTDARILGLSLREGDDASCRNLSRAQSPPILGVDPVAFGGRFTFVQARDDREDPWTLLAEDLGDRVVPAVIDQATFWTLGQGLGGEIALRDEAGRRVGARIVGVIDNAVLHGHLVVSRATFRRHWPSATGSRVFLVDAPSDTTDAVAAHLTRQLTDRGLALARTEVRLNAYNAVENTYLAIFQALGAIGLLLGSVGLALVVARNVAERREEFTLLAALGFTGRRIERLVAAEHVVLLGLGLLSGLLASGVSLLPALLAPGARVASPGMGIALVALAGGGALWAIVATRVALSSRDGRPGLSP